MTITSIDPSTGETLARLEPTSATQLDAAIEEAFVAYVRWRSVPAPARAALVRALGERVRAEADRLAELVTREVGKIPTEARGEVQEVIDICEFAAGLGRTLPGSLFPSERPDHRLFEQWHPLGPIAVITAFNFPMAVWAWNAALAVVCGDAVVWKPSPLAPLCALELHRIAREVADAHGVPGLFQLVLGGRELGQALADD
ncbi:MAG: aldehyde dehydrogenase family protein, partial [Myxococcales bacterium]|nr:aldehyde dehydrogenase family protein [Myxococcales bacterium]